MLQYILQYGNIVFCSVQYHFYCTMNNYIVQNEMWYLFYYIPLELSLTQISPIAGFENFEKLHNFQTNLEHFENYEYFKHLRKNWMFCKVQKKIYKNLEEKKLLDDDITSGFPSSCLLSHGIPPLQKWFHVCMNYYVCWSHDWIWPIGLEIALYYQF